ncbi:hypothetical protein [Nitrospira sp. KM1]|uniref:hypothetical protein n=1 Tax=Nitrospira sp. KM1 TaxID=1936990 RepID=UPI0015663A37|nr:hypothetical protein [Nitrospira sp. KM1]
MTAFVLLLALLGAIASDGGAADSPFSLPVDPDDPASLIETNRVLAEEVRLATTAQMYVLIDLRTNMIFLRGRAVDLYRIPIVRWSLDQSASLIGIFRLSTRPSIDRRKIDPAGPIAQEPVSLADMPAEYSLLFQPALTVDIVASTAGRPLLWLWHQAQIVRRWAYKWWTILLTGQDFQEKPRLELTLSTVDAQSLAWSVIDGTPFLIRRAGDEEKAHIAF